MPEITYLPDDDAIVHTVARWHQDEWGHLSSRTVADRVAEFAEQRESRSVPLTLLAWADSAPVGTASLLVADMDSHPELTPWLGSVYVHPDHRRRGIASALCRRAEAEARRLGLPTLYLFTPDQAPLYARLGWEVVGEERYHGELETVMRLDLRNR